MESIENTSKQPPGEQTFRDELDERGQQYFDEDVAKIQNVLQEGGKLAHLRKFADGRNAVWQKEIFDAVLDDADNDSSRQLLTSVLELPETIVSKANRLNQLEKDVRRVCNSFDAKTKCVIAALEELASVEGCSVGVKYGSKILYEELRCQFDEFVELAQKVLPSDPDIVVLSEVYQLADFINSNC